MTRVVAFNGLILGSGIVGLALSFARLPNRARVTVLESRVIGIMMTMMGAANLIVYYLTKQETWLAWLGIPIMLVLVYLVEHGYIH